MNFDIDAGVLEDALNSIQVKGKHLTNTGFTNSSIGQYAYCSLEGNNLTMYNGDSTFIVCLTLEIIGERNGAVVIDTKEILPYLRSFRGNQITVDIGDYIIVSCENRTASIPLVVTHPNQAAIQRMMNLLNHVSYQPEPELLFNFGKGKFEGCFTLPQKTFANCLKNCELVKNGIYKLDFKEDVVSLLTRMNVQNKYEEHLEPMFTLGDAATIEFSGPLYSFFNEGQLMNFYMKDEFPLLIVSDDRMLIKAPYVNGE